MYVENDQSHFKYISTKPFTLLHHLKVLGPQASIRVYAFECAYASVCVRERQRETGREKERDRATEGDRERERQGQRDRGTEGQRDRGREGWKYTYIYTVYICIYSVSGVRERKSSNSVCHDLKGFSNCISLSLFVSLSPPPSPLLA